MKEREKQGTEVAVLSSRVTWPGFGQLGAKVVSHSWITGKSPHWQLSPRSQLLMLVAYKNPYGLIAEEKEFLFLPSFTCEEVFQLFSL